MGVHVGLRWRNRKGYTGESMQFMSPLPPPKKVWIIFYSFDAFGKVCFQSAAAAVKQIERKEIDCVEEREFQRRAEERASGHREGLIHLKYLIFTLSEEWLFSLMLFSSIHTNSSSHSPPPRPSSRDPASIFFPLLSPVFFPPHRCPFTDYNPKTTD